MVSVASNLEAIKSNDSSNRFYAVTLDAFSTFDACGGFSLMGSSDKNYVEIIIPSYNDMKNGITTYLVVSNGVKVIVTETNKGDRRRLKATPAVSFGEDGYWESLQIANGFNNAFDQLFFDPTITNDQINSISTFNLLKDTVKFTKTNYGAFSQISNEGISKFVKHAVIGTFASYFMSQTGIDEEAEYNQIIGFWTSYFAERSANIYNKEHNTNQKIYMFNHSGKDSNGNSANILGLVGIGNMTKTIANAEHGDGKTVNKGVYANYQDAISDTDLTDKSYGIMNLNESKERWYGEAIDNGSGQPSSWLFKGLTFGNANWKSNPFVNIGGAIGYLFTNILYGTPEGTGFHTNLSEANWLEAAYRYNKSKRYIEKINASWILFNKIKGGK